MLDRQVHLRLDFRRLDSPTGADVVQRRRLDVDLFWFRALPRGAVVPSLTALVPMTDQRMAVPSEQLNLPRENNQGPGHQRLAPLPRPFRHKCDRARKPAMVGHLHPMTPSFAACDTSELSWTSDPTWTRQFSPSLNKRSARRCPRWGFWEQVPGSDCPRCCRGCRP